MEVPSAKGTQEYDLRMEKMRPVLRHVKSQHQWESGNTLSWEAGDLSVELERDIGD